MKAKACKKSKPEVMLVREADYALKKSIKDELDEEAKTMKGAKRFSDPEKAKAFLRSCVK